MQRDDLVPNDRLLNNSDDPFQMDNRGAERRREGFVRPGPPADSDRSLTHQSDAVRITQESNRNGTASPSKKLVTISPPPAESVLKSVPHDLTEQHPLELEHIKPRLEEELLRILSSKTFHKSTRLRRMLEYMVRQYLAGTSEHLKEYTLGVEVFERGPSFDPGSDPIVRVEALRLRGQVERYYATEGKYSTLRIEIPKGSYGPVVYQTANRPIPTDQASNTIVVLPFSVLHGSSEHAAALSSLLRLKLIHLLTQAPGMRVISQLWSAQYTPTAGVREIGEYFGVELVLDGTLSDTFDRCCLFASVASAITGYNVWSGYLCGEAQSMADLASGMAEDMYHAVLAFHAQHSESD